MKLHHIILIYFCTSVIVESSKDHDVMIEPIDYGSVSYFTTGVKKSIICRGVNKNQKVEWVDPSGKVVPRQGTKRVYGQEHFVPSLKSRVPALVLTLSRTTVSDTGIWTCRSGNVHREVSICVIDPAEFVSTSTEITADRGRSITLSCQAKGDPEPRIVWYRNGDVITDQTNPTKYKIMRKFSHEGFEGLLTIVALNSQDSGVYTCGSIQENPILPECALNKNLNVTLHVNYPPFFEVENETALVPGMENKSVDLVCSANGYPAPKYRWFKDIGNMLSEYPKDDTQNDDKSVLTITATEFTFGQRYICRASNMYGTVEKTFEIYKMGPPEKPSDVIIENAAEDNLGIKITWNDLVKFPIDEINIQYKECAEGDELKGSEFDFRDAETMTINDVISDKVPQSFDSAVLKDLRQEAAYCIRVRASNEVGVSPWSEVAVASTTKSESLEDHKSEPIVSIQSNTFFYGIFFGCGIGIVAVAYMFAIRLV
ncbi:limbic system-associated membrane protein-like isoform X2 [Aricia agestis]|uniref:limbic system-associated membrane protein-like isoform X2 n=1 Tax=Aricia agestis TaxID=91739 RepID=UPI001C2017C9|nr:limbic system-associated membrane protein-like isoform X2 [Aricia agestis]